MPQPTLRRSLNLPVLVFYGVGSIMGAGIYALVGKVTGTAGMYAPFAFFLSAVLAGLTAYSYAFMSSRYPVTSSEAVFVHKAFNIKWFSLIVGLAVALSGVVSAGAITHGFVGYFQVYFDVAAWIIITVILVIMCLIAVWGIRQSAATVSIVTAIEVGGLLLVMWAARENIGLLPEKLPQMMPALDMAVWSSIFAGAFLAFYAFIGFEDMVNIAEEVQNPTRVLPWALGISLLLITILYCGLSTVALLTLSPAELNASDAPLAHLYEVSTGNSPYIITVIGLLAVVNGLVVQIIMASRIFYGLSSQGWLPAIFRSVNAKTQTPIFSTVFVTIVIIALTLLFPIVHLAKTTSAILLTVFALVNLSAIVTCVRERVLIHTIVPTLGFLATTGIVVFQLYSTFIA